MRNVKNEIFEMIPEMSERLYRNQSRKFLVLIFASLERRTKRALLKNPAAKRVTR